ncbi:MAG: DUF2849 domain-containing protein [Pelagibacteraceae bacterium]|jgi:hypothetical protein|nr:DUF2849 domain-containing protein [Pelagibacteraceae bacterium]
MKKILTANYLLSGKGIYLTSEKKWIENLSNAAVFDNQEDADNALTFAETQINKLQSAYLIDVIITSDGRPKPKSNQELIRATGPTNYFHGKQSEKN